MAHWLLKSEPSDYAIADLAHDREVAWNGVRNFQARNFLRDDFKVGDLCLIYHSSCDDVGVAGVAEVKKVGIADETQFQKNSMYFDDKATRELPIWYAPIIKFIEAFPAVIPLSLLRKTPPLKEMRLLQRGNRLSVMPVTKNEFQTILGLR